MARPAFFTVCSNDGLAAARATLGSASIHHPDAGFFVCLADRRLDAPGLHDPAWTVIEAEGLPVRDFAGLAFRHDRTELQAALKPFAFRHLLERLDYEWAVCLDPGARLLRPLAERLVAGAPVVLATGLLSVRRGGQSTRLLAAWARRARFECTVAQGASGDRAFLDAATDAAPDCHVATDSADEEPRSAGHLAVPAGLYAYGRFASGAVIHPLVRQMFRTWHTAWPDDPFVSYETFLHEPWPGASRRSPGHVVTNFQKFLYDRLPRLHTRLDLADAGGARALVEWYASSAAGELHLDPRLIEPVAARLGRNRPHGAAPASATASTADVTVVGYLRAASGVGEVGRQTLLTLSSGGLATEGVDVSLNVLSARDDDSVGGRLVRRGGAAVQVFNINADQVPAVLAHTRDALRADALRIGIPFWELARFPDAWLPGLASLDEIWAPSRFIQAALAARLDIPVLHMPVAIEIADAPPLPRAAFGLPERRFLFFFAFDFLSYVERKNPYAAIAAFRLAFPSRGAAGLVLKCMNGAVAPEKFAAFQQAVGGDPDIFLIDETLSRAGALGLIAATDAIVSLHRSEGLGLLVAEAMLLGKPVIATDYAATQEFVTDATGYPVGCALVALREGDYPFWEDQVWADPDIAHAAWHMRRLAADPDDASARRANARALLRRSHGRAAVGRLQAQRLRVLLGR